MNKNKTPPNSLSFDGAKVLLLTNITKLYTMKREDCKSLNMCKIRKIRYEKCNCCLFVVFHTRYLYKLLT